MVVGVVAENTTLKSRRDGFRTDTHTLSLAYGLSSQLESNQEGFDTFKFKISHNEDLKRPNSYGGLSGSPIWRIADSGNATDHAIYGIVFYQSDANEHGERTLICNGPTTIYRNLADAIAAKTPTTPQ